jgi:hypothetical protein
LIFVIPVQPPFRIDRRRAAVIAHAVLADPLDDGGAGYLRTGGDGLGVLRDERDDA